jgi:hypothetical protein
MQCLLDVSTLQMIGDTFCVEILGVKGCLAADSLSDALQTCSGDEVKQLSLLATDRFG